MPKVSVVIPVYGVEKYIERCAVSLFEQTLDDIEFVFVDDCTPDRSIDILEHVIEKYRLRFVEKNYAVRIERLSSNSGQATVRRKGVSLCSGDYIIHCDSDDWVAPDMYEQLYNMAVQNDYDMVWCDYFRSDGIHHEYIKQESNTGTLDLVGNMLAGSSSKLIGSVWNRLYKRRLHQDIVFPTENMNEDLVIVTQLVLACKKIGYLPKALYYYYINPTSICMQPNEQAILRNLKGAVANNDLLMSVLEKRGLLTILEQQIVSKKIACKELLIPLLGQRKYRDLWRSTFAEVNSQIISNSYISRNSRVRALCLLYGWYPLYALIKKVSAFINR